MRKTRSMLIALLTVVGLASAQISVDPELPSYERTSGVSGSLSSIGSDTLNNLMALWAEAFQKIYPNVRIGIEGKGSSTAPPALIEGTAQLGPMSRAMKSTEIDKFEKSFGYKPTEIRVAIDALALFVHKDNPIEGLSLVELDGIFSSTRTFGGKEMSVWGDAGLTGQWARMPMSLYGRNSASGTYGFYKEKALGGGDFKSIVKEQPGSSAVVQGIAGDLGGIGYSGIGYVTSGVKIVPLSKDGGKTYEPTVANALSGRYPLARFLYIYVNNPPNEQTDKLIKEFLTFVLSKEGQEVVVKDGYFPVPAKVARETLQQLD